MKIAIPALLETQPTETMAIPAPRPVPADKRREEEIAEVAVRPELGPRLERMSSGEVSLITATEAIPVARPVRQHRSRSSSRTSRAVAVLNSPRPAVLCSLPRFAGCPPYARRPGNIQILNAARTQRLAARTRAILLDRGWRKI